MSEAVGTIEQRIFDALLRIGTAVHISKLYADIKAGRRSVQTAMRRLRIDGTVEPDETAVCCTYRLAPGAQRPQDNRGGDRRVQQP